MLTDDEKLSLAAYVVMSGYRERVVNVLHGKFMTPKYIAENCGIRQNHISKTLKELKACDLVVCINEEAHKGRVYKLTEIGEEIYQILPSLKGKPASELPSKNGQNIL